ncbi:DUF6668 family protein [Pengzhenrongella sp.]|uniref:DUF6668 family protein n=1 Tax=Pengzhenrongella sp. TaxID=2888820 RepID=UPI002F952B1E
MAKLAPSSPWAVPAIGTPLVAAAAPEPVRPRATRPAAPTPRGDFAARTEESYDGAATFVWLGAHGGAGVSALAGASGQGVALTMTWPVPALGWPARVAVVCRTDARGMTAAGQLLGQWAGHRAGDVEVVALVAVADSPARMTKVLRLRLHELSGSVPVVVIVPWIASWRENPGVADPAATKAAAQVAALTGDI